MSDEEKVEASEPETTETDTDPEISPEETGQEGQDNQAVVQREKLYQTKYQETKAELDQLKQYYENLHSGNSPDISKQPDAPSEDDYDLSTWEGLQRYTKALVDQTRKAVREELAEERARDREERNLMDEANRARTILQNWIQANGVPIEIANQAIERIAKDFPNARPAKAVEYIIDKIRLTAQDNNSKQTAERVKESTQAKLEALQKVKQPKEGAPLEPKANDNIKKEIEQNIKKRAEKMSQGSLRDQF